MIRAEGYLHFAKIMADAAKNHGCVSTVRPTDGDPQLVAAWLTGRLDLIGRLRSHQFKQGSSCSFDSSIRMDLALGRKVGVAVIAFEAHGDWMTLLWMRAASF